MTTRFGLPERGDVFFSRWDKKVVLVCCSLTRAISIRHVDADRLGRHCAISSHEQRLILGRVKLSDDDKVLINQDLTEIIKNIEEQDATENTAPALALDAETMRVLWQGHLHFIAPRWAVEEFRDDHE